MRVDRRRREKKASSRAGLGFSDAPSVDRSRPLVYLSFYQSGNVPISLRDAAAANFALAPVSALVAPVICQHICRRPKPFHSMAMTLELQRPLIRSDPIRKTPKKPRPRKGVTKKERGKGSFLSRVRILSATIPFLYASLFPLFRLVSLKLGRSFLSLTPANSQIAFLQLINFNHLGFFFTLSIVGETSRQEESRFDKKKKKRKRQKRTKVLKNPTPWRRYRSRSASSRRMWSRRCSSILTQPSTMPVASFETRLPKLISANVSRPTLFHYLWPFGSLVFSFDYSRFFLSFFNVCTCTNLQLKITDFFSLTKILKRAFG